MRVAGEEQASAARAVSRADSLPVVVAAVVGSRALRLEGVDNNREQWGIECQGREGTRESSKVEKAEALNWHSRA